MEIYTSNGWTEIGDDSCVTEHICCDCRGNRAERITDCGRGPDGDLVRWAHCADCADESRAETQSAADEREYNCERDGMDFIID